MKNIIFAILAFVLIGSISVVSAKSFHDFKANNIKGEQIDMASFKGKRLLVVNVASLCGYTPQYADLEALYKQYGGDKFEIIGFPANNFGSQELGTDSEIEEFCTSTYGVTFTMMSKISVKGSDMHEIYQWLTQKSENGVKDAAVQWNFQKFMIDENGNFVDVVFTATKPQTAIITDWLDSYVSVLEKDSKAKLNITVSPNPFKSSATINYRVDVPSLVKITIYNNGGEKISELKNEMMSPGEYSSEFNGKNLPNGIYHCEIIIGNVAESRKISLVD